MDRPDKIKDIIRGLNGPTLCSKPVYLLQNNMQNSLSSPMYGSSQTGTDTSLANSEAGIIIITAAIEQGGSQTWVS